MMEDESLKINRYEEHYFKGTSIEEHYEKKLEDFTAGEWIMLGILAMLLIASIISGIRMKFGVMVILIGVTIAFTFILVMKLFRLSKDAKGIVLFFFMLGMATSGAGILMCIGNWAWLSVYLSIVILSGFLAAGMFCLSVAKSGRRTTEQYALAVEATCVNIDVSEEGMVNTTFRYVVNGAEYRSDAYMSREEWKKLIHGPENKASIRVNPENPMDIMPVKKSTALESFMGICFIGTAVLGAVALIVAFAMGVDFANWLK